jgi:hypothetical protein
LFELQVVVSAMLHVGIAICDPAGMLYQMIMLASSQKKNDYAA